MAGYDTVYTKVVQEAGSQTAAVTNEPNNETGSLIISKTIDTTDGSTLNPTYKTFKFTLWNSGKYLSNKHLTDPTKLWATTEADRVFSVKAGEQLPIMDVPVGDYILTELVDEAQIGGYRLVSVSVNGAAPIASVNSGTDEEITEDCQTEVSVSEGAPASVTVTNTYEKTAIPKTSFAFGKLWVIPDPEVTDTLIWPENTSIRMSVYSRVKGSLEAGKPVGTYTLAKAGSETPVEDAADGTYTPRNIIGITPSDGAPALVQQHDVFIDRYNHYTFLLDGNLDAYDDEGNELEYYAVEDDNSLVTIDGKTFGANYGYVDGIAAHVVDGQTKAVASDE